MWPLRSVLHAKPICVLTYSQKGKISMLNFNTIYFCIHKTNGIQINFS